MIVLEDITLHGTGKCQPRTILESIILHSVREQARAILEGITLHGIKKQFYIMLEGVNLVISIKAICIYARKCQLCIIHESHEQIVLESINLAPLLP